MKAKKQILKIPLTMFAIVACLVLGLGNFSSIGLSQSVHAQAPEPPPAPTPQSQSQTRVCEELKNLDAEACNADSNTILQSVVKPVLRVLILVVGAVSVIVIVISGVLYVISAGDANNTKRAKDALLYAVIGLVVALFAQAIVTFVIQGIA